MATSLPLLFFILIFYCCLNYCHTLQSDDARALQSFAAGILDTDPSSVLSSWNRDSDICTSWKGVDCTWVHREFRVTAITLSHSNLQGTLSPDLGLLTHLTRLDLSGNRLSGPIPSELASLPKLRLIDLSHNRLTGQIPISGIRSSAFKRAEAFAGNPDLCGSPLSVKCPSSVLVKPRVNRGRTRRSLAEAPAPSPIPSRSPASLNKNSTAPSPSPTPSKRAKKRRSRVKRWAIGAAIGVGVGSIAGVIVGALGRMAVLIYKNSKRVNGPVIYYHKINPKMLAFIDGPESFQNLEMIGEGGAGKVYKADLENGMTVAIKRIPVADQAASGGSSGTPKSGAASFGRRHTLAEMETLGKIRHNNLAWLYAYIPKPDAHLLVYQYMPGGSLHDALLRVRDGTARLDWSARRRIAVGMVKGIKYLHFDCTPKILHRDLKPSNILLDEELEAHLSDFGLAKALPDDMTHVTTNVAGTVGYIAPEYAQTYKVTAASDVYSMGIVLGVILCGREPTDDFFKDMPLVEWMCLLVQTGQEMKGIDEKLVGVTEEEGGASVEDVAEMKLAMRIACLCTKSNAGDRPTSKDVLVMLNPSKVELRPMTELIND